MDLTVEELVAQTTDEISKCEDCEPDFLCICRRHMKKVKTIRLIRQYMR